MDKTLQKVIAIVLSDELEPDRINQLLDEGLASYEETVAEYVTFDGTEEADRIYNDLIGLFESAQGRNGSRGWWTTADKYARDDERGPRCRFDDEGNVVGTNY